MPEYSRWTKRVHTKPVGLVTAIAVLATLLAVVVPPTTARAVGTVLFENNFDNRTVDGTGTVTKPTPASGTNAACLTASGNTATLPLLSCPSASDAQGAGKLRLTNATTNQIGGVFGATSFPSSNGLDVTFKAYQWGGGAADGMSFVLSAVDPANPVPPTSIGPGGGSLGYSPAGSISGLLNAYLGVGFDVYGNYSSTGFQGTGCTNQTNITAQVPGAVVVRGPGNVRTGYCGLTTTYAGTTASRVTLRATTRAASLVPAQVLINPTNVSYTSDTGVSVSPGTYKVVVTPVGGTAKTLTGPLPAAAASLYPSTSWTNANGVPKQLAFGFVGSTGSVTDNHEIDDVRVLTFNPVPQLAVSTTSYVAATPAPGAPVNYTVTSSIQTGSDETAPVSVTQTTPTGVVPVGAYGTGWSCAAPSGRSITCTTTASSFANGTTLPNLNVVAIVTGNGMTAATVQNSSTTTVSSADANPATDSITTAGTVPAAPTAVTVTPAIGSLSEGGKVTITGSNITAATAIEIGTTAEQQGGTPVVLLPCQGGATFNCFTVSGSTLIIASMPGRASPAAVTVTVVTLGTANAANYTYADKPAVLATPTATAGITSTTLSWVAPDTNGSPITGYIVTPWLNGVAQTPTTFDASTTTRTFTGLIPGGSYRYTVQAVNTYGTSAPSPQSAAVVPYNLPAAPVVSSATAGTQQATLTWTTPASNGSAIIGYVVTPYIGTTAQPAQTFNTSDNTQTITGLTAGVTYTFTVAAKNAAGTGPASALSAAVTPNASPTLTFTAPPPGEVGAPYSTQLTVTNGTSPFVWSVSAGNLPAGLTLSSTGSLSGTPTTAGSFPVTVRVVDSSGQTASRAVTLTIAAAPALTFNPADGEVTLPYSQQPTVSGGTAPFVYTVSAGSLPAGLTLNPSTGVISGTPTADGTYSFTLKVTDSFSQVSAASVNLVVVPLPTFDPVAPNVGRVGVAYSDTFTVSGGSRPLTWSITAGSLPAGLTLNSSTGVLSGTPTTVGSFPFTISAIDAKGQSTSRSVTVVITAGPLVIVKTANVSSAQAGAVVGYTITITNSSSTAFTAVNLSDPLTGVLDDAVYQGNGTATTGTVTYAAPTLTWSGNVAANGSVTITYSVKVNNPGTGNRVLSNTVTSTTLGTNCASGGVDPRCTATVTVAGLTITKTANAPTTTPGSAVRFNVTVTNTGQTAYTGATFTDPLAGVLDDASYNGDATTTTGSINYTNSALTWTGNLAVGSTVTVSYSVTVANPDLGDRSLTGTVTSPTAGSSCPNGNPASSCSVTVTVLVPALSITNVASSSTTTPGATVTFTQTLANTGQTAFTGASVNVELSGALDDATWADNTSASAGTLSYSSATGTLVWTGNLAIGAVVTITDSVVVRNPDPGDRMVTALTTSTAAGSTCPPGTVNSACTATASVLVPALTITKSADTSTTTPGSVVRYTVTVSNSGQTSYSGANVSDSLAGILDDATYDNNVAATSGAASYANSTISWTGNLAVAATVTITYSVTVRSPDTGNRQLTGTVTSTTPFNNCPVGGADSRCVNTVSVLVPELTVTTTADSATTTPGAVVALTTTVKNTGQTVYAGAVVNLGFTGVADDASYNNDASSTTGSIAVTGADEVTWTFNLAPGETATTTGTFTVNNPVSGNKTLTSTATSSAVGSTCRTPTSTAACTASVAVLIPSLTITKTANASALTPGEAVTYSVVVTNTGETSYPEASFDDSLVTVLDDASYAGGATATSGTVGYTDSTLSWRGALAVGATATITYSVTVRDPDPGDKRMTNTVVSRAAGSNCPPGSTDSRCAAVVNVLVPQLTLTKTANASTTAPGQVLAYTVTVTNTGATAYTGASFSDPLSAGVLDDATYNNNASASTGSITLAGSTLTWSGNLTIGATATITYSVTVRAAAGGDNRIVNSVSSTTAGSNCAPNSPDGRCTVGVPVARLTLTQTATEATATPGSVIHVTAVYTNTGQVPYTGISVSSPRADTSDDTVPTGDQKATSGTLLRSDTSLTWTGSIPVGGSVTITRTLTVKNPDPGNRIITATLNSTAPGNNCPTGTMDGRCTFTTTVVTPGLALTKTANSTFTTPGGVVSYTITITNSGETAYQGATVSDTLAGVLDDATYTGNATATSGTVTYDSPTLTWTGDLAVGATATVAYSVTAATSGAGDHTMANSVSSTEIGSTCPPASSNTACRATVAVLSPGLTITNTASTSTATLGSAVTYTVTVTNTGQTPYAAATFTESLSDVLDDATITTPAAASRGTATIDSQVLSWTGALAVSASATVTFTVTTKNPAPANRTMDATVVSSSAGSNCASDSGDSRCRQTVTVVNSTTVTFTHTAAADAVAPGGIVRYTVEVSNRGTTTLPVSFNEPLSAVLDDATYNGDATATSGTVSFNAAALTWQTAALPAGATVTVTYSVTVRAAVTGDQILTTALTGTSTPATNNCPAASTDGRCLTTVTVARLDIQQSYTDTTTTPGSVVRLTATFTNTGATDYEGITITSPSSDTVDDATANGDQTATSGSLVLTASAITWTGNIAVGATVTVTGTVTVQDPDPGNKLITGTLVTTALGSNCAAGSGDTRCTASLPVKVPELTITKAPNTTTVAPNGTVAYTILIHNTGETPYRDAAVTDSLTGVLDDATYNANAVATLGGQPAGTLTYANPTLTWTGDVAVGQTITITYSVTARRPATGDKNLVNTVASTEVGSTCEPGSGRPACVSSVDVRTPAVTTAISANRTSALPGDVVTYTITVTNNGQTAFAAANLTAPLAAVGGVGGVSDDAVYSGGATATVGSVTLSGTSLVWTGPLAIGAVATITYSVTVQNPDTGNHLLAQTLTSTNQGTNCPVAGTDPRCSSSIPIASLQLTNSVDVTTTKPTGVARYTGTFTNTGQVPYVGVTVVSSYAGALDDAVYNGDAATSSGSVIIVVGSGQIVWTGDIAVGQTVTVTGSVTVKNPTPGNNLLTTVLSTTAPGTNCAAGSTDPVCSTNVTVLTPQLTITKTADRTTVTPGGTVNYTITVQNTGETAYTAATFTDSLEGETAAPGDGTISGPVTASSGGVDVEDNEFTWTGDLAVAQTAIIRYTVLVSNPDLGDKVLVNDVTSQELGSTCPTDTNAPACRTVVTVLVPALDITLTTNSTTTTPGATVDYTLVVANTGQTPYFDASVTAALADVLDDAAYDDNATSTLGGSFTFAQSNLTWTGDLPVGASTTISYSVTVADPDLGNNTMTTSVSSSAAGSTCTDGAPCVNLVTILIPGLDVSTTADTPTATPGDRVSFTITIRNTGQTNYVSTTVTTDLSRVLDDATFSGTATSTTGVTTYTAPRLTWTGSLAVGSTAVISYDVTVQPSDPGDDQTLVSTAVADAAGSTCTTVAPAPTCTATVTVLNPGLTITKSTNVSTVTPGGTVTYTINITNTGQTAYTAAVVSDSLTGLLSDATYNNNASVTGGGVLTYTASTLRWTGDLLTGATATITYSVAVRNPDPGDKLLSNSVISSEPGSSCPAPGTAPGCSTQVRVLVPALGITQTADTSTVVAGGTVRYTVQVSNTGATAYTPATFTDSLTGILDDATYAGDASATSGSISYTNNTLVWTGPLAIGASATITFSVNVNYPALGNKILSNTVLSSSPGSTCVTGARAGCRTAVTVLTPALTISKTASATSTVAGGSLDYTILAINSGQAAYPSAQLFDDLTGVLDEAALIGAPTASIGTVTVAGSTLSWDGPLPVGAAVLITYSVTTNITDTNDGVLTNTVTSSSLGSNCPTDSVNPQCSTTTPVASGTLSLVGVTPAFTLTGPPNSTASLQGAVGMTVETNNFGGYTVTVQSERDSLTGRVGNPDSIPIERLKVRPSGDSAFTEMSADTPVVVHTQDGASAPRGDGVSTDYQVDIPFVASDDYSTTLEYIVTAR